MNILLKLYRKYLAPIIRQKIKQIVLTELERMVLEIIQEKAATGNVPIVDISRAALDKLGEKFPGTLPIMDTLDRLKNLGLIRSKKLGDGFMLHESFELTPDGVAKLNG